MSIRYISGVPNAPQAIGAYSQATIIDNLVFLSGQIPLDPETGEIVSDNVEEQCDQVMRNLLSVLGFLQIDFSFVLKSTIFLTDMNDFQLVNNSYSKWLYGAKPARSTIQVAALPLGAKVEIEMVAVLELSDSPTLPEGSIRDLEKIEETTVSCKPSDEN